MDHTAFNLSIHLILRHEVLNIKRVDSCVEERIIYYIYKNLPEMGLISVTRLHLLTIQAYKEMNSTNLQLLGGRRIRWTPSCQGSVPASGFMEREEISWIPSAERWLRCATTFSSLGCDSFQGRHYPSSHRNHHHRHRNAAPFLYRLRQHEKKMFWSWDSSKFGLHLSIWTK